MAEERFKSAENEYFRLRGLLAAGRLTQQQFEAALKELMPQDAQGRYWSLGASDGKWYVHDGKAWVQSSPYSTTSAVAPNLGASGLPPPPAQQGRSKTILTVIAGALVVCLCIAVGFLVATSMGLVRINPFARNAPILLPTPLTFQQPTPFPIIPTIAPLPTPLPPPTTTPLPTNTPTLTFTATPTITPTLTFTATPTITPTLAITATPTKTLLPEGNCADPNARWENVTDGQTIDPYMAFSGIATSEDFAEYRVEWLRPGNVLHRSATPVVHGVIFVWNTYTVENGDYPVALIVARKDGTTLAPCVVVVRVRH